MERYSHLQAMPNSPLTPLTPLSENTKFEFNFGGDGSLDAYIDNVRHEQRVEKQQKKLLSQANEAYQKQASSLQPRRYSDEFLKIREVFEVHNGQVKAKYYQQKQQQSTTPKAVQVVYTQATPTATQNKTKILVNGHEATPTNVRTPLKPRNHNIPQNLNAKVPLKHLQPQPMQQPHMQPRVYKQASPIARRPLCPQVAKILTHRGLNMYAPIFQREEIDLFTFRLLKPQDLHQMGITNQKHITALVDEVYYFLKHF